MPDRNRTSDLALLLFGVGALVLVSRARNFWATGQHWFAPFVLWFALIVGAWWVARRRKSRDP